MRKFYSGLLLILTLLASGYGYAQTCAVSTTNPNPTPAFGSVVTVNATSGFSVAGSVTLGAGSATFPNGVTTAGGSLASPILFYTTTQTSVYFKYHLAAATNPSATINGYTITLEHGLNGSQTISCTGGAIGTINNTGTDYYFSISGISLPATYFRIRLAFDVAGTGSDRDVAATVFQSNAIPAPAGAALPVKLDNFDAASAGSAIKLTWTASDEAGVAKYEIERSTNGTTFQSIGFVTAENKRSYSFTDYLPTSATTYYRLKILDLDGRARTSHIVSAKSKAINRIETYPNPVKDRLIIQHPKATQGTRLQVMNIQGQLVRSIEIPANAVVTPVDLSSLRSGSYYIVFKSATENFSQRIVKE